jgi:hypothetical protein
MAVRLEVATPAPAGAALLNDAAEQPSSGRVVRKQRGRLGFSLVRTPLGHQSDSGVDEAVLAEERREAAARAEAARRTRLLVPLDDQIQLAALFQGAPAARGA